MDVLLFALSGLVFAGLGIMAMRSRHRVVGDEPRCGKCQYDLRGARPKHCPECGYELKPGHVQRGMHTVPPSWRAGGALLILMAVCMAYFGYRRTLDHLQTDWYSVRPDFLVIRDIHHPEGLTREYAADALAHRLANGTLSEQSIDDAAEAVAKWNAPAMLPMRSDGRLNVCTVMLLLGDHFDDTQKQHALRALCPISATMIHGQINVRCGLSLPRPGPNQTLMLRVRMFHIQPEPVSTEAPLISRTFYSGTDTSGWQGHEIWHAERTIHASPVTVELRWELYALATDFHAADHDRPEAAAAFKGLTVDEIFASDAARLLVLDTQQITLHDNAPAAPDHQP